MLLAHFLTLPIKNATYGIARGIGLNSDIMLMIKMLDNQGFGKYLPQLGKSLSSVRS